MSSVNSPEKSSPTKRFGWESLNLTWIREDLPSINQEIRLLTLTWNMQGKTMPSDISELLLLDSKHHLLLISTQECLRPLAYSVIYSKMQEWEQKVLNELGPDYELLAGESLGGTHLMLIAHASLSPLIKNPQISTVTTGFFNFVPNKGAVRISFNLAKYKILAIGCHMASGTGNVSERNEGVFRALDGFQDNFDLVVLFGDLNYRIQGNSSEVIHLIDSRERSVLLKKDELSMEMNNQLIYDKFREGQIMFRPTFKMKNGTYDGTRIPSWTDRILFKTNEMIIEQKSYSSIPIVYSDHFPVFSQFLFHL